MVKLFLISMMILSSAVSLSNQKPLNEDLEVFVKIKEVFPEKKMILFNSQNRNIKFFKREDEVLFFDELNPSFKCRAVIERATFTQILVKTSDFLKCRKHVAFMKGSSLKLESDDLKINLKMASEVIDVLLKKRMIFEHKIYRMKNQIQTRDEREELLNSEYQAKINALKLEWQNSLENLKYQDKTYEQQINEAKIQIQDIDKKLKLYNVESKKIKKSEWSLKTDVDDI